MRCRRCIIQSFPLAVSGVEFVVLEEEKKSPYDRAPMRMESNNENIKRGEVTSPKCFDNERRTWKRSANSFSTFVFVDNFFDDNDDARSGWLLWEIQWLTLEHMWRQRARREKRNRNLKKIRAYDKTASGSLAHSRTRLYFCDYFWKSHNKR